MPVEVVVDRLQVEKGARTPPAGRLVETALKLGAGVVLVKVA
jgi:hypothetical protein